MSELDPNLATALAAVDTVEADAWVSGTDTELLEFTAAVEALGRKVDALRVRAAVEIEHRSHRSYGQEGLSRRHGHRAGSQLVEQVTGVSAATARKRIQLGQATTARISDTALPLPPLFPVVESALADGSIGVDAAVTITRELQKASKRAPVDQLEAAERSLVDQATGSTTGFALSADLVTVQAKVWRDALDPDGIEPRADEAFAARGFWISRTARNGLHAVGGNVTSDVAGQWFMLTEAMMTPKSAPKFVPDTPCGCHESGEVGSACSGCECTGCHATDGADHGAGPGADFGASADPDADQATGEFDPDEFEVQETRTPEQQGHDLLATTLTTFAKSTTELTVTGAAPTVLVTVKSEDLLRDTGTGRMVGVTDPVPMSTVKRHLCDGGVRRAVIGPFGELVALENEKRLFTKAQRLAMIARDGPTCLVCTIPATATEAHHVIEWSADGRTAIDNGVLLCYCHHRLIERGEFEIEFVRGKPKVRPPCWLSRAPYLQRA